MGANNFGFRDILLEYHLRLARIKLDIDRGDKSLLETSDTRYVNLKWFQYIRDNAFNYDDFIEEIRDKRTLNRKEFRLSKSQRCPGCEDGKPYKAIKYRNVLIPIYDDDYGQQDFAVINGEEISGGCYNFNSHIEFINYVDYMLEKKYLRNEYDMHKEVEELYPEINDDRV